MFVKHLETWSCLVLCICADQISSKGTYRLTCPCPVRCTWWTQRLTTGVGREEGLIFLSRKVQKKENILAVALEGPLRLQSLCQSCTAGQPLRAGNIAPVLQRARFWKLCFLTQSFLQHLLKVSSCYTQICGFFEFSWVTVYTGWIKSRCKLITSM